MNEDIVAKKLEIVREMVWRADSSTDASARLERLLRLFDRAYEAVSKTMGASDGKDGAARAIPQGGTKG